MAVSTSTHEAQDKSQGTTEIDFYFDVDCPWAWRASLWVREVARVRPVTVHWKFMSLEYINSTRKDGTVKEGHIRSRGSLRLMALARREVGEEAVDRLYLALGQARHDRNENIGETSVLLRALDEAGLDRGLLDRSAEDQSLVQELDQEYSAIAGHGGFGVPTIVVGDYEPLFGPVISRVPSGEEAGELWDHTLYFIKQRDFFEIKREIRH